MFVYEIISIYEDWNIFQRFVHCDIYTCTCTANSCIFFSINSEEVFNFNPNLNTY